MRYLRQPFPFVFLIIRQIQLCDPPSVPLRSDNRNFTVKSNSLFLCSYSRTTFRITVYKRAFVNMVMNLLLL